MTSRDWVRVLYPRRWDIATLLLLTAALLYVAVSFDVHGISNDEPVQHRYGQLLLDYYRSGFSDKRVFDYINLKHYGGLFDMIAAGLAPHVPYDVWDLRHLLTGLFGLSGLVAVAWLGRLLGGARTGYLAALLLALCGSWSGAMFTHTKDIPFAAATIWSIAFSTCLLQQLPRPRWGIIAGTGIAMGCALGLRYGGILLPGYLGLCLLLALARGLPWHALLRLWPIPVITVALMGFFWPWSVTGWDHFLITARAFSHYDFDLKTLLDGVYVPAREIPTSYLFQYLLRTLPEVFLWGLGVSLLLGFVRLFRRGPGPANVLYLAPLMLSLLVPFAIVVLTRPALYNGLRHFTFVLPSLAVFSAVGLDRLSARLASRPRVRAALAAIMVLLALDAAALMWRLHPYEYVAYNRLSGGVAAAYGRWELDYWSDGLRELALKLNALVERADVADPERRYLVAICAEPVQGMHYLDRRFAATKDWPRADFFLTSTSTRCDRALEGEVVATVEREGVPLALIKDRRQLEHHERGVRDDDGNVTPPPPSP
jgi:hypothetical protein